MAIEAAKVRATLDVGFDNKSLNRATRDVDRAMNRMAQNSKAQAQSVKAMTPVFAGIGGALVASFAVGAAAAAKFEQQFADVKKTLDVKGEGREVERQFANIAKEIRNIAKFSPATVESLNQIAAIGGQLGIQANNIVKFTDTIQKLTVATNLGAEQAALSLARLQKITGLATNDLDNLASTLVKLGNNFATTESEIITAATQIATATAGTSNEFNNAAVDALAYATSLRAIGQPAQAGSTAIIRLIGVVDRAAKSGGPNLSLLAKTAGMTEDSFRALESVDPNRAIALFLAGLGDLEKSGGDAIGVLEDLSLGQIRSRRALMALSRAQESVGGKSTPLLIAALDMANQEFLENNALLTEAERKYETVISQIGMLTNTVQDAGIEFGSQFLPAVNNVIQGLLSFVTATSDIGKTVTTLTKFLGTAFGIIQFTKTARNNFKLLAKDTEMYAASLAVATGQQAAFTAQQTAFLAGIGGRRGGLVFNTGNPLAKPGRVTDVSGEKLQEKAIGRVNLARKKGILLIQKTINSLTKLVTVQAQLSRSKQLQLTAGTPVVQTQSKRSVSAQGSSTSRTGEFAPTSDAQIKRLAFEKKLQLSINKTNSEQLKGVKGFIKGTQQKINKQKELITTFIKSRKLQKAAFTETIPLRERELQSYTRLTLAQKVFSKGTLELASHYKILQTSGLSYWKQIGLMTKEGITLQQMYNAQLGKTVTLSKGAQAAAATLSLGIQSVAVAITGAVKAFARMAVYLAAFQFIFQIFERAGAAQRSIEALTQGQGSVVENTLELSKAMADLEALKAIRAEESRLGADEQILNTIDSRIANITKAIEVGKEGIKQSSADLLLPMLESARGPGGDIDFQLKSTAALLGRDIDTFKDQYSRSLSGLVTDIDNGRLPTINTILDDLLGDETAFGPELGEKLRKINREFDGGVLGAIDQAFSNSLFGGPDTEELIDGEAGRFLDSVNSALTKITGRENKFTAKAGGAFGISGIMDETFEAADKIKGSKAFENILGDLSKEESIEIAAGLDLVADTLTKVSGLTLKEIIDGGEIQFKKTAAIVQARISYLNKTQKTLVASGALDFDAQIDAAKDYEGAAELVARLTKEQFGSAADNVKNMREELGMTDEAFITIIETIEDQLKNGMEGAINIFRDAPEKMLGTFEDFALRLKKKISLQSEFSELVKELSVFAPLLAKQFAEVGPAAMDQLKAALATPQMAGTVEAQLLQNVGPELQEQVRRAINDGVVDGSINEDAYGLGGDLTAGIIAGIESKKDDMVGIFRDVFIKSIEEVKDYLGIKSPSMFTMRQIGMPMIDGVIAGIKRKAPDLEASFKEIFKNLPLTIQDVVSQAQKDFSALTQLTGAIRGVAQARRGLITAEHEYLQVLRDRATFQERLTKNTEALRKAEISGRVNNITVKEEIGLLRNKLDIQKQIDKINGVRTAGENLAIFKKEEELADLRLLNNKGVVSNLELAAAEEDLSAMKGENLSDDERKLSLLELTQAQKDNSQAIEDAKAISDELVSLRQENNRLIEEEELLDVDLTIATNSLGEAKERVLDADLRLESARAAFNLQIASDGEFVTRLLGLTDRYNDLGNAVKYTLDNIGDLSGLDTAATKPIEDEVVKQLEKDDPDSEPIIEPSSPSKKTNPKRNPFSNQVPNYTSLPEYIKEQIREVSSSALYGLPDYITGMAMGGRVKKYKYGGRGDVMKRALVGEYGPEEVKFIPGNGFLVKPLSTGGGGTVVQNLNVNVTGVPSDPISARKAAQQISKALRKLDKEGNAGTGLRRN
jgi:TP901 family phage tail tape measure protein